MQIILTDDATEVAITEIAKSIIVAERSLFGWKVVKNKATGKIGMMSTKELKEIMICV